MTSIRSYHRYLWDLVYVLTLKELKVRYKNTWLGYAWSLANPLAFAMIYFVAFGVIMKVEIPNYPLFLIAGLLPWQWLSNSINAAPMVFLMNASLLKKVRFPKNILLASTVLIDGIHFLVSIPVILGFLLAYHKSPTWAWVIGIPILAVEQFILVYGLALAVASLNLFFRDLERLTSIGVTFLFFLTPIVYLDSMIPAEYRALIFLNPVRPLVLSWQELFLAGSLSGPLIAAGYVSAFLGFGIGSLVYGKLSGKFAEVI